MSWVILVIGVAIIAGFLVYAFREARRVPNLAIDRPRQSTHQPATSAASRPLQVAVSVKAVFAASSDSDRHYYAIHLEAARTAQRQGKWDEAADRYARASYLATQLNLPAEEVAALHLERYQAVADQPIYRRGIAVVREHLARNPGELQSTLTKTVGENAEDLRFLLYCAEQVGHVVRVKHGRSYRLFLPGQSISTSEKPPKKSRNKPAP